MVKTKKRDYIRDDGSIDTQIWLHNVAEKRHPGSVKLIAQACHLSQIAGGCSPVFNSHQSCLQQGLIMAEMLFDLHLDQHAIAAAILYNNVQYADLAIDVIAEQLGSTVAKLITGAEQMDTTHLLLHHEKMLKNTQSRHQMDNLRKMLLAMVEDVRVVLIKLAERTCLLRLAAKLSDETRHALALEAFHIYAPLANRLGIGQIKWELEDLCLRYLQPETYMSLAKKLDAKRIERETFIENVIQDITQALTLAEVEHFEINGRAKHIYSIYRKMQRKNVDYDQIYDVSAVRVMVQNLEDCYAVLSTVHTLWTQIPEEFDDYISHPKPNGYRSLHTAVIGPGERNVEVQIRTFSMHQESELGVAAHWKYKEGGAKQGDYEDKIAWLRQVLEWQSDLVQSGESIDNHESQKMIDDRIYVFTPSGEIVDLPQLATPLDFAYHIHTEVGHRCRGAKINGHIVPLSHKLSTGERIEILTHKHPQPSRDWLSPKTHYVYTHRAKAKIHHYFRRQDYDKNLAQGLKDTEQEIKRLGHGVKFNQINFETVAKRFNYKIADDLFAAIGNGDIKMGQVTNGIKELLALKNVKPETIPKILPQESKTFGKNDIEIEGIDNLLSFFAGCCKPIPGDDIIGFITRGRGVSIHRSDCLNIKNTQHPERLIGVDWSGHYSDHYPVDIRITANERQELVRDILNVLTIDKIPLLSIRTQTSSKSNLTHIEMQVKINNKAKLAHLLESIRHFPDVIEIARYGQKT